ncbi:MAG: dicarboxylate/amino acid:cation symporter [Lachnospiraceae bacterium]|nr:dicarboxylate/amino acid:cation symporter [Lachnospiraceae bacterium]
MTIDFYEWGALLLAVAFFALLYYLKKKKNLNFGLRTILALGLGVIVGVVFKGHYTYVAAFGTIYAHVISAIVIPLLIFSITASITNLSSSIRLKNIGFKTVFFLVLNTFIASTVTLIASVATNIGDGFEYELATDYTAAEVPTFVETIISLFPSNLISHWADGEVVPIVLFVILLALSYNAVAAKKPEQVAPFKAFIDAGNLVMGKVVSTVIGFTPYAVLSLVARAVSRSSVSDLLPLLSVLVLAYVLCAFQLFVVEGTLIKVVGRLNPIRFFKGIWPAGVVAFTSQSSVGTIPVTVNQLTKKLGVNEDIASFGASLGANLGMPGCAGVWPVLLAVFAVHILGLDYSPAQYLFLIVLAVVVSIGTVGVPGTATITATAVFAAAGLPVEVIVLLSPISSIVDMARTATNVVGAATATTLVAATEEGQLDRDVYNGVREIPEDAGAAVQPA